MATGTDASTAEYRVVDRFDGGVGWIAYPGEAMQRASHALFDDGDVWLVDPLDADGLSALWADHGDVAGVVLLLDRHKRDAAALADRHDVSVWLPTELAAVSEDLAAPVERFDDELAATGYRTHPLTTNRLWREVALYHESHDTLIVPEAVGTEPFTTGDERLGVHPALRLRPPRSLTRYEPQRILVGHGPGVHDNASVALRQAIGSSRRGAPAQYWSMLKAALPV